jgi:DNA-directed RNA polymerase subunit RPC12/RpoP
MNTQTEIDEWKVLLLEAKDLGLTVDEIKEFFWGGKRVSIAVKKGFLICTDCNERVLSKRHYMENLHRDDPEYFFEPWDNSDLHLYVCPKCKKEDFPS